MTALDRPGRRVLTALSALAAIGLLHALFLIGVELDRTLRHRTAIAELSGTVAELEREVEQLRAIAERGQDTVFREQLARRQGFMHPHETRVIVVRPE